MIKNLMIDLRYFWKLIKARFAKPEPLPEPKPFVATRLVNPNLFEAGSERFIDRRFPGGKFYLSSYKYKTRMTLGRICFRTASAAQTHAEEVLQLWKNLYKAYLDDLAVQWQEMQASGVNGHVEILESGK